MFILLPISVAKGRTRWPIACMGIALACVAMFLATWVFTRSTDTFSLVPSQGVVQIGWATSMFIHYGWLHLLGNLLFFYLTGPLLEDAWGPRRFLVFYLAGGLVANLGDFLPRLGSTIGSGGASGAIAACMGAFVVRFHSRPVKVAYVAWVLRIFAGTFEMPAFLLGGVWILSEVYALLYGTRPGVAVAAHVAGFAFGAIVAIVSKARGLDAVLVTVDEVDQGAEERRQLLEHARQALDQDKPAEARPPLAQLLALEPRHETAPVLLGEADVRERRGSAGWEAAVRALKNDALAPWVRRLWTSSWGPEAVKPAFAYEVALRLLKQSEDALGTALLQHAADGDEPRAELELVELARDGRGSEATAQRMLASLRARRGLPKDVADRVAELAAPPRPQRAGDAEVVSVKLRRLGRTELEVATALQIRTVPLDRVATVRAGEAAMGRRQVQLVDLFIRREDPGASPLAFRLTGDDPALAELYPGKAPAEALRAFADAIVAASGAARVHTG